MSGPIVVFILLYLNCEFIFCAAAPIHTQIKENFSPASELTISEVTENSLKLRWGERHFQPGDIVFISKGETELCDGRCIHGEKRFDVTGEGSEVSIPELCPGMPYSIVVVGNEKPYPSILVETLSATATNLEVLVNGGEDNSKHIILQWRNPSPSKDNKLTNSILFKMKSEADFEERHIVLDGSMNVLVPHLNPWTEYFFKVRSYLTGKTQICTESNTIQAITTLGIPNVSIALNLAERTGDSINLIWTKPEFHGEFKMYRVDCGNGQVHEKEDDRPEFTCEGLQPHKFYKIKVAAVNTEHQGQWSEILEAKTDVSGPGPVQEFQVVDNGETNFKLQWKEPVVKNGPIDYYVVRVKPQAVEYTNETSQDREICPIKRLYQLTIQGANIQEELDNKFEGAASVVVVENKENSAEATELILVGIGVTNNSKYIQLQWISLDAEEDDQLQNVISWKKTDSFLDECRDYLPINWTCSWDEVGFVVFPSPLASDSRIVKSMGSPWKPVALRQSGESNSKTIEVEWDKPYTHNPFNGEYSLRYKIEDPKHQDEAKTVEIRMIGTKYKLKGLIPWRIYQIAVRAIDLASETDGDVIELIGQPTRIKLRTKIGVPKRPKDVTINIKSSDELEVQWTPVKPETGPTNYNVVLGEIQPDINGKCTDHLAWKNNFNFSESISGWEMNKLSFVKLTPNNCYRAIVISKTDAGESSSYSSPIAQTLPQSGDNVKSCALHTALLYVIWTLLLGVVILAVGVAVYMYLSGTRIWWNIISAFFKSKHTGSDNTGASRQNDRTSPQPEQHTKKHACGSSAS